ncbi:MAG: PorT family protein [Muribaculaceae bacterium]|nr:PorT family protein [Muribaculaceae bacterium]
MKKIIIALVGLVALLAAPKVQAQSESRWGVTAGANYNYIHFKQPGIIPSDRGWGPVAGVTGEVNIQGIGFSVDGSVLYSMRTGKLHYGNRKVWSSLGLGDENCLMHNIDLPLSLKFKFQRLGGFENTLMPMIYAGPTFSFLVGKNLGETNDYNPVSVFLRFGAGVEIKRRVQLTVSYSFSIGETFRTRLLDEMIAKNRYWNASVTYYFK